MILPDTSAWIEFLGKTGSPVHMELRRLIEEKAKIVTTEIVIMEVLAGATSKRHFGQLRSTLAPYPILTLNGSPDYEEAARIYRTCRVSGATIRNLTDCLIAVPAIRAEAEVLHNDSDFDLLAQHTPLRIHPLLSSPSPPGAESAL